MTIAVGILTLVAMLFSFLALTDIAHGEKDQTLEWIALRVTGLIITMFVLLTFVTLRRAVGELRKTTNA
jgi:hypothetical protein